jgi:hypothetical protein
MLRVAQSTMQAELIGAHLRRRAVIRGLAGIGASLTGLALAGGCGSLPFATQNRVARIGWMDLAVTRLLI